MRSLLTVLVAAAAAAIAAGHPPASAPRPTTTYRDFYIPRPDAIVTEYVPTQRAIPQPPRRVREYVQTWYVEEAETYYMPAPSYSPPGPSYAPPATYSPPAYYAAPVYAERRGHSFGLGLQIGGRRGLRAGLFFD